MVNLDATESEVDAMSLDEIEEFLSAKTAQIENNEQAIQGQTEEKEDVAVTDDKADTEDKESTEDKEDTSTKETGTDNTTEVTKTEKDESPYYKGKTREELLGILENQNKYISRQNNTLDGLRNKVDEVDKKVDKVLDKPAKSEEDDLSDIYTNEERDAARRLIQSELTRIESEKSQKEQAKVTLIEQENSRFYENLKDHPEVYNEVDKELREAFRNAGKTDAERVAKTVHKPGWVMERTIAIMNARTDRAKATDTGANERAKKAATIKSTTGRSTKKALKSVEDMSAEEYKEYAVNELKLPI